MNDTIFLPKPSPFKFTDQGRGSSCLIGTLNEDIRKKGASPAEAAIDTRIEATIRDTSVLSELIHGATIRAEYRDHLLNP